MALRLGSRAFTRADLPFALSLAEAAAWGEDRGEPAEPARERAAVTLVDALTPAQLERIDALPTNDPRLRSSRLAWLRAVEPSRRPASPPCSPGSIMSGR